MRDLSGTGQVYRFTLSQLLKSRANRVTLIIMVLLAAVSMPLTALLGGETPETSDTAGLTSVRGARTWHWTSPATPIGRTRTFPPMPVSRMPW